MLDSFEFRVSCYSHLSHLSCVVLFTLKKNDKPRDSLKLRNKFPLKKVAMGVRN